MNARLVLTPQSIPRLAPHMRLRHDTVRGQWTVQAPERSFLLDDIAQIILSRCDGKANLEDVIASLCADFPDAPYDVIAADVTALLQDLIDKGVVAA